MANPTAYRPLPMIDPTQKLKPPARYYGVRLPSLAGIILPAVLVAISGFGLLFLCFIPRGGEVEGSVLQTGLPLFLGVVFFVSIAVFLVALPAILIRRTAAKLQQEEVRRDYIRDKLLPFVRAGYGFSDIADKRALLRGFPAILIKDGYEHWVVLVTLEDGSYALADAEDWRDRGSCDTGAPYCLPYSFDRHAEHGDGSFQLDGDGSSDGGGDSGGGGGD